MKSENIEYADLITAIVNSDMNMHHQHIIIKLLERDNVASRALTVCHYHHLGHGLHCHENGAYLLASDDCNCSPDTCRNAYLKIFPPKTQAKKTEAGPEPIRKLG